MMNYKLIFLLFIFSFGLKAEESCELIQDDKVNTLAANGCEVVDRLKTCAQITPDPDALRKKFEAYLNRSEEITPEIQKRWKGTYQNSDWAQFFRYDSYEAQHVPNYIPTHLVKWFTDSGKNNVDPDAFKSKLVANYVDFAKKNDCTPVVKNQTYVVSFPLSFDSTDRNEINKIIKAPDYNAKKEDFFNNLNSNALETISHCDKNSLHVDGYQKVGKLYPPCSGNISALYQDNIWNASSLDDKLATEATSEVIGCIKSRLANGAKLHHVSIRASASALNNTGTAANKFCKKGFLDLSKARAESARDTILPKLFAETSDYQSKVILDYQGTNGDGTSGPCPYILKNGVEVLKDEYKTIDGKKILNESKFVKIHVTFESHTKTITNPMTYYSPRYNCKKLYFECGSPINISNK